MDPGRQAPTRRQLLNAIGLMGGTAAVYQLMTTFGHAAETRFPGPPDLSGSRKGQSVIVLGAGLAGMLAAYELDKAGYRVRILEFQDRAGGRNWSLRGGDRYTELGGPTQNVAFAKGNYFNPGPWRIPHHHRTLLYYCKKFGVALEPFIQFNHNAYVHSTDAFGGAPQRFRALAADFEGNVAELLGKAIDQKALDTRLTPEDLDLLREALRGWGMLDRDMRYVKGDRSSSHRGFLLPPGGGVNGTPKPSDLFAFDEVLKSRVWANMAFFMNDEFQTTMFQPVGGMDMIGKGFARQVGRLITYNAKVTRLMQGAGGVTVTYADAKSGKVGTAEADFCVCTIPLTVLSQIETNLSEKKQAAIQAVPYSPGVKVALEMRRRFWEEDYAIYGGHSFTNQEIGLVSYPNDRLLSDGPAVLLGAFANGPGGLHLGGMTPDERIEAALEQGSVFHPDSYRKEFLSGASVSWSRVPWAMGCCARWNEDTRREHYQSLVSLEDRVVLAGEHASYVGCWMEGSLLSAIDAITRLHKRAQEA
ncbi:flavin monoamine oxidase family protein [Phenylobacterium sp. SCN 70-31]|uniref:flavin monoamine oxidase family protein n=1 Tax=Phenylobacterium sp. SCN 70-31 TaxID=1660129 RepID=UPI0008683AC2|nr:flavin monoamine oxidase family protein [Phenylobacterium sp. SCN 70-31]ODT88682.1 MAG: flavin monoamine oxidase [Phenylobacterium sp. SCN 70-31]